MYHTPPGNSSAGVTLSLGEKPAGEGSKPPADDSKAPAGVAWEANTTDTSKSEVPGLSPVVGR